MKCLVTGGAGFIGSNLALELEKQSHAVIVVDNLFTGTKDNLKGFKGKFIQADISKPFKIEEKFDMIFHEAAITDPRFEDDKETIRQNVDGFKNIIALAQKNNAKLIYASSASLYGNGAVPMKESQKKQLLSAYARSKLMMDEIAETLFKKMHIVGLRYFNVFGPREQHKGRPASMIFHLAKQIKEKDKVRLFKFGEQKRDHIYVKDAVDATIKAADAESGIYNVGTGIATSFNEVVKTLNKVLGKNAPIEYFDNPYKEDTYQANTQADTEKAEKFLKFRAKYSFEDGVKDYMRFLR